MCGHRKSIQSCMFEAVVKDTMYCEDGVFHVKEFRTTLTCYPYFSPPPLKKNETVTVSQLNFPETHSSHLKMDGWNTICFLLGHFANFQGRWV